MQWRATSSLLERASLYLSRCDDVILPITEHAMSNMPHAASHSRGGCAGCKVQAGHANIQACRLSFRCMMLLPSPFWCMLNCPNSSSVNRQGCIGFSAVTAALPATQYVAS